MVSKDKFKFNFIFFNHIRKIENDTGNFTNSAIWILKGFWIFTVFKILNKSHADSWQNFFAQETFFFQHNYIWRLIKIFLFIYLAHKKHLHSAYILHWIVKEDYHQEHPKPHQMLKIKLDICAVKMHSTAWKHVILWNRKVATIKSALNCTINIKWESNKKIYQNPFEG